MFFQIAFVVLNLWIAIEFLRFVQYYETAGQSPFAPRPAGVEGWLPIAALMNLKYFLLTGSIPQFHAAAMFLLIAFLTMSWLWPKSFCSWLCPIGTLSEVLWKLGERLFGRTFRLPRWFDIALRSLKYILLSLFLYAVGCMSAAAIAMFMQGPYGLIADVKMLNFFRFITTTAVIVIASLVVLSVLVKNFWCRYLCPHGALMGLASLFGPGKIRRDPAACIDCGKCASVCPAMLPVDQRLAVRSIECTSCLECVTACPIENALCMTTSIKKPMPAWVMPAGIALIFLAIVSYAKLSGHWDTAVSGDVYFYLIPRAQQLAHP
jgi:polyferredoxin